MKVEISYDKENDEILFTEIKRKRINLDSFFSEKLYAEKKEKPATEFRATVARTYIIIDFPHLGTLEDFKAWVLREKESEKLIELLKEVCRMAEKVR